MSNLNSRMPETTGRYLVLFREDATTTGMQMLRESSRISFADVGQPQEGANSILLSTLGVAVVNAEPEQLRSLRVSDQDSPILAIETERVVYALADIGSGPGKLLVSAPAAGVATEYLRGYRDAVNNLIDNLLPTDQTIQAAVDESVATWGLQATKVVSSSFSGRGIKVAVLDTGLDLNHPDFVGRSITSQSFISGEEVQDGQGHGTHCIGTACGPLKPNQLPRYGIAYNAEIYAGKVLSNEGSGTDGQILQGIEWAIANGCNIISMSLGALTRVGEAHSPIYEAVAQRALSRGSLIVVAAGNESGRPGTINPVGRPANCPSMMAVAALDSQLQIASFSNRGLNPDGGQVDIAGPGVNVYSSRPMPKQYESISGTSMATPHVAGIAALHAEATGLKGQELWSLLTQTAHRLPLPSEDIGTGLVQAP